MGNCSACWLEIPDRACGPAVFCASKLVSPHLLFFQTLRAAILARWPGGRDALAGLLKN